MTALTLVLASAIVALAVAGARPALACWAAASGAAAIAGIVAWSWVTGEFAVDSPWSPLLGSRLVLELDDLGAPLAFYAAAMAVPVLAYSATYIPVHLEHKGRPIRDAAPFVTLMLGFALAMVLLTLAQDLLIIFLALEVTALISFLLIRFDGDAESVGAARLALVLTAGGSLLFLVGLVIVAQAAGTTVLAELRQSGAAEAIPDAAIVCLALGVIAKSAQVPLHFWLPRAMTAPTPVSAYLHSAALVAAGVFVLQRIHFLLEGAPWLLDGLFWLGFASIGTGALFALASDEFKRVLAYSTIAQYGYCLVLLSAGGKDGLVGAPLFIVAHGLSKCALFMTAGAVTQITGEDRLSRSGGLGRAMPLLAASSLVAAAGLAGLPLTIGFFKDDLFLKAALEKGALAGGLAAVAIALTFAYIARFWFGIFGGTSRPARAAPHILVLPCAALAGAIVVFGVWLRPLEPIFAAAATEIAGTPMRAHIAYPDGLTSELLLTLIAWAAGAALWRARGTFGPVLEKAASAAARIGPDAAAAATAGAARRLSDLLHRLEVRDARDRLAATLSITAAIVLVGIAAESRWPTTGSFHLNDLPLAATLLVAAAAAPIAMAAKGHFAYVLLLSFVGMSLTLVFALAHAPEIALVLALVETILTLLFIAVLSNMRHGVLLRARREPGTRRSVVVGFVAGLTATATAWLALSATPLQTPTAEFVRQTASAHGKDVVTVILADFRGLDTAGELTVVVIAIVGAAAVWAARWT